MSTPPPRIRIFSALDATHFLHVEDATAIGKVRLFAGSYLPGTGATVLLHHYVDVPDVRVLCHALMARLVPYDYVEYKGTVHAHQQATSRILRIHTREDRVWIEFIKGAGRLTRTGAISPVRNIRTPPLRVTFGLEWHTAQAFAHETLAFLRAWDVIRALTHRDRLGSVPDYAVYVPRPAEPELTTFADGDVPPDLS